ncbi:hypothetical protein D0Z00_004370 [Geotrichum galactomycetum]|uniref:Uncharacterized protein n=1 Tax=Geotrichum galactomycetum TaxID=27317 RepID=A0ACB6UYS1_9ASCO|nr:hypothetical protein D0Z00_004370 [Geotrichum candidum]
MASSSKMDENGSGSDFAEDDEYSVFDAPGDFGINKNVARAALTALGSEFAPGQNSSNVGNKNKGLRKKAKKKFSEMDDDEKLLASEAAKNLTSRQKRQLRNRVSARHFRLRRKEYISHLEGLVVNMTTKINRLEIELKNSLNNSSNVPDEAHQLQPQQQRQDTSQESLLQHASPTSVSTISTNQMSMTPPVARSNCNSIPHTAPVSVISVTPNLQTGSKHAYGVQQPFITSSSSIPSADSASSMSYAGNWPTKGSMNTITTSINPSFDNSGLTADIIRMKPNVVNLLPVYPDMPIEASATGPPLNIQPGQAAALQDYTMLYDTSSFVDPTNWQMTGDLTGVAQQQQQESYVESLKQQVYDADSQQEQRNSQIMPNQIIYSSIIPELSKQILKTDIIKAQMCEDDKEGDADSESERDNNNETKAPGATGFPALSPTAEDKLSVIAADALLRQLDLQMSRVHL